MSLDREYRIRIVTVGDPSGANAVGDALRETKQPTEEASESTLHLGHAHRELHMLMEQVTEASPALGIAMRAATGGAVSASVMALVLVVRELSKAQEESRKKAEELADQARETFKIYEDAAWAAKSKLNELREEHDKWIGDLVKGSQTATSAMDAQIAKIKEQAEADKAAMEARKAMAEDEIRLEEAQNQITHEDAAARLAVIEAIGKGSALEMGAKGRAAEIAEVEKARAALGNRSEAANWAAFAGMRGEEEAAMGRGKRLEELPGLIGQAQKAADQAQKDLESAQWAYDRVQNAPQVEGPYAFRAHQIEMGKAQEGVRDAGLVARDAQQQADALKQEKLTLEDEQRRETARVEELKDAAKKLNDELEKLTEKLNALRASDVVKGGAEKEQALANAYEAATKTPAGQTAIGEVQGAEATADALRRHQAVSEQSKQKLVDISSALAGHAVSLQGAVAMMEWTARSQDNFVTRVIQLIQVEAERRASLEHKVDGMLRRLP